MVVRLREVAALAGVSVSTASRALARPNLLSASTVERVRQVAAELGYAPYAAGVALRSGRYGGLTIMLHNLANPLFARLVAQLQQHASERGFTVQVVDSLGVVTREREVLAAATNGVDGVIALAPGLPVAELADAAEQVPLVVVNRSIPGVASVLLDAPTGLARAIDHLAELGHQHVAYICGPTRTWSDQRRRRRIYERSRVHGIHVEVLGPLAPVFRSGLAASAEVRATGATAVVAYNSLIALGLTYQLRVSGLRVPDDVSIVSGDDMETRGMSSPALTSVHLPIDEAARRALELLEGAIGGERPEAPVVIETPLLIADSTGEPGMSPQQRPARPGKRPHHPTEAQP